MILVSTAGYFHFLFSGLVVAPKFREAELYTVAGYFGHRFGEKPRFVVMIVSLLFSVFIVAVQMTALGLVAMIIAVLWPDVIELLLFTYHIWAPAIIVPVVGGVFSKERSAILTRSIFGTMLIAIGTTFIYKATLWSESFDPAVFGVLAATIAYFAQRAFWKLKVD